MDTDNCFLDINRNCSLNNDDESFQTSNLILNNEYAMSTPHPQFGFIPKGPLTLYTGNPVHWQLPPDAIQAHFMIRASGLPNYLAYRIPVESQLKCQNWAKYLHKYWDTQLVDLLTFGFLLDFNRQIQLIPQAKIMHMQSKIHCMLKIISWMSYNIKHSLVLLMKNLLPLIFHL